MTVRSETRYFPKQTPWNPHRPVKVIVVGAGISGVSNAVLLSHKVPNVTITIYDRLSKVGGTWAANVYPGVRCDVPSHVYQLSFEPNPDWSEYYPKGAEIQAYYDGIIKKHGLADHLKLNHQVLRATWLADASQWAVEVRDLATGETIVDTADFVVNSQGRISDPKWPDIPGLRDTYRGTVVHTARWPEEGVDLTGKRVAVIGNGASAQQLVPNIIGEVSGIDHYVRTNTWVTPTFVRGIHEATADAPGGPVYSEEDKRRFRDDPAAYLEHRRAFEINFHNLVSGGDKLGSKESEALRQKLTETMRERLGGDEEWLQRLLPDYAPGCKRLTPAPGYLEAVQSPKVDFIRDSITSATATGLVTADGTHREVDVIVAATGFDPGFTSRFPVIGAGGVDLRDKWSPSGPIGYPESYLGVMAPGFPNYFFVLQAQGNARGGSVPLQTELTAAYIAKAIRKVQSQSYAWLAPTEEAAQEFNDVCGGFFEGRVTGDGCDSWFKQGKGSTRVVIAWPGSFHHRADALREPRWEDFEYGRRVGAEANRFEYFGNGSTEREARGDKKEITSYLQEVGKIDLTLVHELWNQ